MGPMWAAHVGSTWVLSRGPIWDPVGAAQVGPRWVPCGSHMGPMWGMCGLLCGVGVGPIWAGPDDDDVGYIYSVSRNIERRPESGCLGRKGRVEIHGRQTVDGIP